MRRLLHRLALYAFHVLFARPILFGLGAVRYRGRHFVPKGPCLVVSNHNSHLDAAVLMTMFPLRRLPYVHPVAAADYFGSNWFMRAMALLFMNGIPIERRPARGIDPLSPVVERLKSGESLIFFPEGSRGEAGVVAPFRRGVGLIARDVPGLLVLPVFLSGPERIWPRGEVVPVPLNIDAHIGRPQTYPADEDPRVIAERVRDHVLALAPPAPPVPGRRSAPPKRIAICSIDADRRSAVFRAVTERLGALGPTLGVADPLLEADEEGMRQASGPIAVQPLGFWLMLMTWLFRWNPRFRREAFRGRVECAQINEALDHGRETRYAVVENCAIVDFLAFQGASSDHDGIDGAEMNRLVQYLIGRKQIPAGRTWWFMRRAPEVWLINTFDLVRPPLPDLLVHLRVPPAKVMQHRYSAGSKLGRFDNLDYLERLEQSYCDATELLRKRHRVEVLALEGAEAEPEAVASRIESLCRDLAGKVEQESPSLT